MLNQRWSHLHQLAEVPSRDPEQSAIRQLAEADSPKAYSRKIQTSKLISFELFIKQEES
jgi:hypothetical protein